MAQRLLSSLGGTGACGYSNATWSTCRGNTTSTWTQYATTLTSLTACQSSDTTYNIYRLFFSFDTRFLSDNAIIDSATLKFKIGSIWQNFASPQMCLVLPTHASVNSLASTDYDNITLNTPTEGASRVTPVASSINSIALNATGISWITALGYTKLGVRMSHDVDNTTPVYSTTGFDSNVWTGYNNGEGQPFLDITYRVPSLSGNFSRRVKVNAGISTNDGAK